jgi:LCP family protein required for cell wall assembly
MKKIVNFISKIISIILVILTVLSVGLILYVDILPSKYLLIFLFVVILVVGLILIFTLNSKIKSKIKISFDIFSLLLISIMTIGLNYGFKTLGFLDNLNAESYKTESYSVIVLKNSNYSKIDNLKNKDVGYMKTMDNSDKVIDKLKEVILFDDKGYSDLSKLSNDLLDGDIPAILIENSYKSILEEQNEEFKNITRTLYTFNIKTDTENQSITKEVDVKQKPFSVYISGIDTYGSITSVSRSDVNIVVTINPNTYQILLTSIPRDYYVPLHGKTGYKDKLTHAGIYGINTSTATIEDLLAMEINYYVRINFSTLIKSIDAIDGVNVYSKYSFTANGYKFVKGYNYMNGEKALTFSRERHALPGGDRARGENQEAVIEAIIKKVATPVIITKYDSILKSLENTFQTNMPREDIISLVKMQIDKMPDWKISSISLNGFDSHNYTYSYGSQMLYVMEPDIKTVETAKTAISDIITGNNKPIEE